MFRISPPTEPQQKKGSRDLADKSDVIVAKTELGPNAADGSKIVRIPAMFHAVPHRDPYVLWISKIYVSK